MPRRASRVRVAPRRYGDSALNRAILSTRLLPAAEVPRAVLRELTGHRGQSEPTVDALVVCMDWRYTGMTDSGDQPNARPYEA